jgi:hypothetical protein
MWGSLSAVDIDRDDRSVWVAERCGGNSACLGFFTRSDSQVRSVRQAREELRRRPVRIAAWHLRGRDGNIWVTDYRDNAPRPACGAARPQASQRHRHRRRVAGPVGVAAGATKGHQVFKFSPDGKLLLTLGQPGTRSIVSSISPTT